MRYGFLIVMILACMQFAISKTTELASNGRIPLLYQCENIIVDGKKANNCKSANDQGEIYAAQDWVCPGKEHSQCVCHLESGALMTDCQTDKPHLVA